MAMTKAEQWKEIQERWPDLAEFMKSLHAEFGKLEDVEVIEWPDIPEAGA